MLSSLGCIKWGATCIINHVTVGPMFHEDLKATKTTLGGTDVDGSATGSITEIKRSAAHQEEFEALE